MFPFTKKKTPEPAKPESIHDMVRRKLDETDTKLGDAVRRMQERLAQRDAQPIPAKVK